MENSEETREEEEEKEKEEKVIEFLDSLDSYLTLFDSLSSTLRQGWLELASARHSMGSSRITSALFDLKLHSAATTVQVKQSVDESPLVAANTLIRGPQFSLSKWSSLEKGVDVGEALKRKSNSSHLRHRGPSQFSVQENDSAIDESPLIVDDQVQKERSKSLAVFGTLVSPKLRATQVSFETALEILVEIANMRSLMLSAFAQVQQDTKGKD
eukprot:TRINITY_DN1383_c0_g1_i1.p1 TRINITY_DN1383_c0_g1~~TRINITY_DN1383_c0_g1_i1.p1  ORF type:complete len:213 (-),score=50.42 TRINITY_DN1383_c0_g1_i1:15-653(-)